MAPPVKSSEFYGAQTGILGFRAILGFRSILGISF